MTSLVKILGMRKCFPIIGFCFVGVKRFARLTAFFMTPTWLLSRSIRKKTLNQIEGNIQAFQTGIVTSGLFTGTHSY